MDTDKLIKSKARADKLIESWDNNFNKKVIKPDLDAKKKGTLVGRYISEPFADGKAFYRITKETKYKVHIQVVTDIGDDWVIPCWGKESIIDKDYAKQNIRTREALAKLFGG